MNWRRRKTVWELSQAGWGGHEVLLHLTAGWEPFTVSTEQTDLGPQFIIWFRRKIAA